MFQIQSKSKFVKISVSEDSINNLQTALTQSKYVVLEGLVEPAKDWKVTESLFLS